MNKARINQSENAEHTKQTCMCARDTREFATQNLQVTRWELWWRKFARRRRSEV